LQLFSLSPLVGTFSAVLLCVWFPVVLSWSWFYDLTSNGMVLTPADDSGTIMPLGWKNWTALCSILLLSCSMSIKSVRLQPEFGICRWSAV